MKSARRWIGWLMVLALLVHPFSHAMDCHAHEPDVPTHHSCALCVGAPVAAAVVLTLVLQRLRWDYQPAVSFRLAGASPRHERGRAPPTLSVSPC